MKPPYRVPSMTEIAEIPWNGYNAISTFSGGGGSSLGYRMAGYRVLWANEVDQEAQNTYRANKAPYTILDGRDIRTVTGKDILEAIGLEQGQLDLFDSSPPCVSFSTVGKREKDWGKEKEYGGFIQRVDDLSFEFTRLLSELQPKTFVMENVSGLVKGTAKGYFKWILGAIKEIGYKVEARLLDAQWLGVPQARQRVIFVGVRKDLGLEPVHPEPLSYRYSVREAIPNLHLIRQINAYKSERITTNQPSPTITKTGLGAVFVANHIIEIETINGIEQRKLTIEELKRICSFPDDYNLTGDYSEQWVRLGNAVPPVMMYHISSAVRDKILGKQP